MNTKHLLFILLVILAQALAACGTATPAASASEPTIAPTAMPELADPSAIAQDFYKATNNGDIEAAMALVAEDVQCRGGCYLTGKESFRSWIQGGINSGGRVEISDLKVEGDKVTYNWTAYNKDGVYVAEGVETLQIKDGQIILMESQAGTVP